MMLKEVSYRNIKPDPNHTIYIKALGRMSPEQRLLKAMELTQLTRQLFIHGLEKTFS